MNEMKTNVGAIYPSPMKPYAVQVVVNSASMSIAIEYEVRAYGKDDAICRALQEFEARATLTGDYTVAADLC